MTRRAAVSPACVVHPSTPVAEILQGLDRYGLTGTFYVDAPTSVASARLLRSAILAGHEIGNAALIGLTDDDGLLLTDDPDILRQEFEETETFIAQVLADRRPHSIAFAPISEVHGPGAILDNLAQTMNHFAVQSVSPSPSSVWLTGMHGANKPPFQATNVLSWRFRDGESVLARALDSQSWLVPRIDVLYQDGWTASTEGFAEMCRQLWEQRDTIWIGSVYSTAQALTKGNLALEQ